MSQEIVLTLERSVPQPVFKFAEVPVAVTLSMVAAIKGEPGPKGDPGDINMVELLVDPVLLFENALE